MAYIDFLSAHHQSTKRNYIERVTGFPKAEAAKLAKKWDYDYWDGDRRTGYGGYRYDGRWRKVAEEIARHYHLKAGDRVLDVGCGKGFLLFDLGITVPGLEIVGIDISEYAIANAKEEVRTRCKVGNAISLPFEDKSFDLVLSITTLHNLYCFDLDKALREIVRVSRGREYVCVESYRSEEEKANLLYWQFTCEMFCTPEEWLWWFSRTGYVGDYSFIFFE